MRVLVVNYEFPPIGGGGANATRYLARELVRRGHHLDVLTSRCFGLASREVVQGVNVFRVPVRRKRPDFCSVREMATFLLSGPPVALRLASRNRYDLVHVFFGVPCGPLGWLLKRTHGLPYLIRMGGGDIPGFKPYGYEKHYRRARPLVRYLWRDADALVVVSAELEGRVRRLAPEATPVIIPNGIDPAEFSPPPVQRKGPRPVVILTVSRLITRKRLDILLAAVLRLAARTPVPFRVEIVGDGVDRRALESFAETAGITGRVTFRGNVAHADLPTVYRAADIFVLPSLAEGMANVVLEALACGLPVVTTDTGGSLELVLPEVNGFIVPKEDADALANALQALLENEGRRRAYGEQSRARSLLFTWAKVAERTEEVYARLLARRER